MAPFFGLLPRVGLIEGILILASVAFWGAVVVAVIRVLRMPKDARTIATLVEENRRLREEVAVLKGEKPWAEAESFDLAGVSSR